jgi:hypothetical protein
MPLAAQQIGVVERARHAARHGDRRAQHRRMPGEHDEPMAEPAGLHRVVGYQQHCAAPQQFRGQPLDPRALVQAEAGAEAG